jgi:predicted DNA-binding protein (MmcQ/YjbR family)
MNVEILREYCLTKPGTSESFPFDEVTLVIKVMNKMFILISLDAIPASANLKCDPERAEILREKYPEITPGFHMNKRLWNTVEFENSLPDSFILKMVDESYDLVVAGLKKTEKELLQNFNAQN